MISSILVGAEFEIRDLASPALKAISDQLKIINEQADRAKLAFKTLSETTLTGLNAGIENATKGVAGIADAAETASKGMIASFDRAAVAMSASLAGVARQMAAAEVEGVPGNLLGGPIGPGVRPINRGSGGGSGGRPGGYHGGFGRAGAQAIAGGLIYSLYEGAEVETVIAKAVYAGQANIGDTEPEAARDRMMSVIENVARKTGKSPREVGEALLATERNFPGLSFSQRMDLEETMIPYAAGESRMKETSLAQAFEVMSTLPHMTGTYDQRCRN